MASRSASNIQERLYSATGLNMLSNSLGFLVRSPRQITLIEPTPPPPPTGNTYTVGQSGADFPDIQTAIDDPTVVNGDCLELKDPSYLITTTIQVTKQLSIKSPLSSTLDSEFVPLPPAFQVNITAPGVVMTNVTFRTSRSCCSVNIVPRADVWFEQVKFITPETALQMNADSFQINQCFFDLTVGPVLTKRIIEIVRSGPRAPFRCLITNSIYNAQQNFDNSVLSTLVYCSGDLGGEMRLGYLQPFRNFPSEVVPPLYRFFECDNFVRDPEFGKLVLQVDHCDTNESDAFLLWSCPQPLFLAEMVYVLLEQNTISNQHGKGMFSLNGVSPVVQDPGNTRFFASGNRLGTTSFAVPYVSGVFDPPSSSVAALIGVDELRWLNPEQFVDTFAIDSNVYVVFAAHNLPDNTVVVPFLFERVKELEFGNTVSKVLMFNVIGLDKALDVAVAVFDVNAQQNKPYSLDEVESVEILQSIDLMGDFGFNTSTVFYYVTNNDDLHSKATNTTTVQNFDFNGPSNMIQFLYPKSVLVQQQCLVGTSGSAVVDQDMRCIGMLTSKFSNAIQTTPAALHCSLLYTVLFRRRVSPSGAIEYPQLIPTYLLELDYAIRNPNLPNIVNSPDVVAESISTGVEKMFLGLYGQYLNQNLFRLCPELIRAVNPGFVILGFYNLYDLSTNQFSTSTQTKSSLNNNLLRVQNPLEMSFLFQWINSAKVPYVILDGITYYDKYTGAIVVLNLSNVGVQFRDSISTFMYRGDPSREFTISYYIFSNSQWQYRLEEIFPQNVTYNINGNIINTLTAQFPPFALGNETIGTVWNMTLDYDPYKVALL